MLKIIKKSGLLCLIFLMSFYSTVYANPVFPQPGYKSFLFDLIYDAVVIILIFWIFKVFRNISIFKALLYIMVVYINGLMCDFITAFLAHYIQEIDWIMDFLRQSELLKIFAAIAFILFCGFILAISNYFYARFILKVSKKKSIIIGVIFAIFTHPIIGLTINFDDSFLIYEGLF